MCLPLKRFYSLFKFYFHFIQFITVEPCFLYNTCCCELLVSCVVGCSKRILVEVPKLMSIGRINSLLQYVVCNSELFIRESLQKSVKCKHKIKQHHKLICTLFTLLFCLSQAVVYVHILSFITIFQLLLPFVLSKFTLKLLLSKNVPHALKIIVQDFQPDRSLLLVETVVEKVARRFRL